MAEEQLTAFEGFCLALQLNENFNMREAKVKWEAVLRERADIAKKLLELDL